MRSRTRLSNEKAGNPRKLKKSDGKNRPQPKEMKKPRPPVQQNRFTNMLELSTLSASLMQLHDLFGTLVLDFSQDPVQMKISDVTGNYELNVSKESLGEFKMKVLLGQNNKGKPAFTIFLGECQCYPELPEGALELSDNQKEDTGSQIDSIDDETRNESKIDVAVGSDEVERDAVKANAPTKDVEDNEQKCGIFESDDMSSPLIALFEGSKVTKAVDDSGKNSSVTYETHHISISESQKPEPLTYSDELIVKMRPKRVSTRLRKIRPTQKKLDTSTTAARRASKKRSTYRSNLEGFVKFLMTDRVCGSVIDKMKTPGNVAQAARRIGEQKMVNYSDGQEFHVRFSKEADVGKKPNPKGSAHSDRPSNSREANQTSGNDTESADGGGIRVLFERPKPFEKAAFVEQVKKELEEWKTKDEQTVNLEIMEDAKSSSSTEDSDSNVVTVYEDPKTSKKLDTEFDDASSNCCTEGVTESTEKFFLDLKGKEKPESTEEKHVLVVDRNSEPDLLEWIKSGQTHKQEKAEEYVVPIPLETTSTADIEAMWMSFVEMFHQSSELAKKLSVCRQEIVSPASLPEPKIENEVQSREDPDRHFSDCMYPGQHSLPYFVEESLRRVNSMSETWHPPDNPLPSATRKPQDPVFSPQVSNLNRFEGDLTPGNNFLFNPKCDAPMGPPFHHHSALPEKFSIKKSRIFFNPHVSIGDWY